jgi:hypothetical protein
VWDKLKYAMNTIGFEGPKKVRIGTDIHQGYIMYGKGAPYDPTRGKGGPADSDGDDDVPF